MKAHTNEYKDNIKLLGREIDSKITYTLDGEDIELGNEDLNSVSPHYEGGILKSVMKQLDIDSNVDIPIGTEINYQFGQKVGNDYEYLDFGNYIVYSSEKQEDTRSWKIVAYDKMLYAMKDYENVGYTFPMTIRDYIGEICNTLGLTFANINDTFANYDKQLTQDMFLDANGAFLGYTFRDVLDQLAEATASTICINENDELEIRYIENVGEYSTVSGTDIHIDNSDDEADIDLSLEGDTYQYTTTGKNKLGLVDKGPYTWKGITYSCTNGVITLSGTATDTAVIDFSLKEVISQTIGTLTKSLNPTGTYTNLQTSLRANNANTLVGLWSNNGVNKTEALTGDAYNFRCQINNGVSVNCTITPQVQTGSTATSYEQYSGGTASPNPDYPQEIQNVTGRQEVTVSGKNLANNVYSDFNIVSGNYHMYPIALQKGQTYTLKATLIGEKKRQYYNYGIIKDGNSYGTFVEPHFVVDYSSGNAISYTFTVDDTYTNPKLACYTGTETIFKELFTNYEIQLEIGNQATTFEEYKGKTYEINLGKNLIKYPYYQDTLTNNGITWQSNSDGTITLNGTATAPSVFYLLYNSWSFDKNNIFPQGTYTLSMENGSNNVFLGVNYYDENNANVFYRSSLNQSTTFSITDKRSINMLRIVVTANTTVDNLVVKPQIEKGSIATPYAQYFEPIWLGGINDYKDKIDKSSGRNLLSVPFTQYSNTTLKSEIPNFKAGTYHLNVVYTNQISQITARKIVSGTLTQIEFKYNSNDLTFTLDEEATLQLELYKAGGILPTDISNAMLNEGSTALPYEPYGTGWYLKKEIGKVVLNGSEDWSILTATHDNFTRFSFQSNIQAYIVSTSLSSTYGICNRFSKLETSSSTSTENQLDIRNTGLAIINTNVASTVADFKTWLGNNNVSVYYVLSTPTYTKITNQELISQLEAVRLLLGENNISITSSNLSSPISLKYLSERDTIDEEFFKDINVNFGEKYGKVNSIVLSRSAGADNVYLRDEESVEENGLCEIKISDNQIMNGNDRAEYLTDILGKLNGLEYYINDFSSTGITYYDLCDKYKVSIDGNAYNCVMFNDEVNVTQGLEELIHTDMPEETQTDYTKSDKTDRRINQAYSIVDKQNQTITNFVSQTTQTQQLNEQRLLQLETTTSSVQQQLTSTQATIEVMQQDIIDGQETLKNNLVTIDINGINVSTNISKISTLMTNEKFVIKSGDTYLAFFGYDSETGQTKAEMDNLTVTNYFTAGYHRVEKITIDGEHRTGWFYVDED